MIQKSDWNSNDLNTGFVVVITIEAKPDKAESMAAVLQSLVAPTMAEPGVKLFLPYRSPSNPLLFFIFELYVDEVAWSAHQETAHFKAALPAILADSASLVRTPFVPYVAVNP